MRKNKRQDVLIGLILFVIVVVAFGIAGKAARRLGEMETALDLETATQGSVEQEEVKTGGTDAVAADTSEARLERVAEVAVNQGYPQSVIDLLEKNPETVDFVENYGKHGTETGKNVSPDGDDDGKEDSKNGMKKVEDDEESADGKNTDLKSDESEAETNTKIQSAEISADGERNGIPLYIQWDERWGYESFGTSIIGVSGCGATSMAMVVAGLTGDETITPDVMAAYETEGGFIDADNNTYWSFLREGGSVWGISGEQGMLSEMEVAAELGAGHPIICSMGPGDFTDEGHFIVLVAYEDGNVTVNDPFSLSNSEKTWVFAEIESQIKNMWVFQMEK